MCEYTYTYTILAIVYHTIFLSVCVGGLATNTFLYVLLGVEHSINWHLVYRIWKTKKNMDQNDNNRDLLKSDLQSLLLGETLEILIPLAYLVCFLAAYHGPNAEILGNIKNDYWQYVRVDDLYILMRNLLILVGVDLISLVGVFFILIRTVNINLFHVYIYLMKEYGLIFSIHLAYLLDQLFCMIAIACGLDFTFKFDWIFNQQEWKNITGFHNVSNIHAID